MDVLRPRRLRDRVCNRGRWRLVAIDARSMVAAIAHQERQPWMRLSQIAAASLAFLSMRSRHGTPTTVESAAPD